jgi:PII-like signaling protein
MEGIEHEGLLTLERARLGGGDLLGGEWVPRSEPGQPVGASAPPSEDPARPSQASLKLTVYIGRHERLNGAPAFAGVCEVLHDCGVAGATVVLGVDGVRDGQRHRARFFAQNKGVPLMVMAVGDTTSVSAAVERLERGLPEGLLTVERVRVCKRDGRLLQAPHDVSTTEAHGSRALQKLTIVTSEAARHHNRSVYLELLQRLRAAGAAGVTSLRGIWGFHGHHPPHGDRLLSLRRHVPVVTIAIDTPQRITALFPLVDELTRERGLVTSELVPAASALHTPPAL